LALQDQPQIIIADDSQICIELLENYMAEFGIFDKCAFLSSGTQAQLQAFKMLEICQNLIEEDRDLMKSFIT
jgi:hypothetical protein